MLEFSLFPKFYFPAVLNFFFFSSRHMWLVRFTVILAGYPTDSTPQKFLRHLVKKITWVIWILIYLTSTFHSLIVLYSRKIVYLIMSLWLPRGVRKLSKWTLLWNCHHVSGFLKSHKFAIERNSRLSISFRSQRSPWRSELSTFRFVRHLTSIWGPISYIYIKNPVLECALNSDYLYFTCSFSTPILILWSIEMRLHFAAVSIIHKWHALVSSALKL